MARTRQAPGHLFVFSPKRGQRLKRAGPDEKINPYPPRHSFTSPSLQTLDSSINIDGPLSGSGVVTSLWVFLWLCGRWIYLCKQHALAVASIENKSSEQRPTTSISTTNQPLIFSLYPCFPHLPTIPSPRSLTSRYNPFQFCVDHHSNLCSFCRFSATVSPSCAQIQQIIFQTYPTIHLRLLNHFLTQWIA
jgi:hypothetical protein